MKRRRNSACDPTLPPHLALGIAQCGLSAQQVLPPLAHVGPRAMTIQDLALLLLLWLVADQALAYEARRLRKGD